EEYAPRISDRHAIAGRDSDVRAGQRRGFSRDHASGELLATSTECCELHRWRNPGLNEDRLSGVGRIGGGAAANPIQELSPRSELLHPIKAIAIEESTSCSVLMGVAIPFSATSGALRHSAFGSAAGRKRWQESAAVPPPGMRVRRRSGRP